jgi:hypothetical protein
MVVKIVGIIAASLTVVSVAALVMFETKPAWAGPMDAVAGPGRARAARRDPPDGGPTNPCASQASGTPSRPARRIGGHLAKVAAQASRQTALTEAQSRKGPVASTSVALGQACITEVHQKLPW